MRTATIAVLVLSVLWGLISWRWYTCGVKGFCGDTQPAAAIIPVLPQDDEEPIKEPPAPVVPDPFPGFWKG